MSDGAHRVLTVLRGVADVIGVRPHDVRYSHPQRLYDLGGLVYRQRRLCEIRERTLGVKIELSDFVEGTHDTNSLERLAKGADNLFVVGAPDEDEVILLRREPARFDV